ncbi:low-density lipoprotein receptor class A domain-containing protein 3-like [Ptychodera flava]|uniref:low-density lipoprotein receptor class A domain-containing protein 3-like n=1 Tax=Ptychodera flava TaxID=63121 RepID=UPI00396A68C1
MEKIEVYVSYCILFQVLPLISGIPKPVCESEIFCDDGVCVLPQWICDGREDCIDQTDEKLCSTTVNPEYPQCSRDAPFHCSDQRCIPTDKLCDGVKDCEDGIDEDCNSYPPTEAPPMATTIIILTVVILILCGALFAFLVFMQQRRLIRIQRLQHQLTMQRRERQVQVVTNSNTPNSRHLEEISPVI